MSKYDMKYKWLSDIFDNLKLLHYINNKPVSSIVESCIYTMVPNKGRDIAKFGRLDLKPQ